MVSSNPGLAPLPTRPPTPPKESTAKFVDCHGRHQDFTIVNPSILDTPDESPSSSAEYFKGSAERAQKRVGFSPWTEFHRVPAGSGKDYDSDGSIRRLPPSKDCKSLKSILKAGQEDSNGYELMASDQANRPAMLQATILHLASTSRASRLDAYTTLTNCLTAYEDVPGTAELSDKVKEICGYIRRDIAARVEASGSLDTQLVTQALKLLTVIICTPKMARQLPEEFCSFILEKSLISLEDTNSSKILATHYMHLLEKQKFSVKHMTPDRANKVLSAVDSVTARIKGNRLICHRLMIYHRLVGQARLVMTARVGSWIDHLISGLLSTIKEVRQRAIAFGLEAGVQLGNTMSVSQACIEVFNRASPEGKKVIEFLSSRLIEMIGSKEDAVFVPQIWGAIVLFFRSRRGQLETWEHFTPWLNIMQRCLNSSDSHVKTQAYVAWCRLIYATNLDASTSDTMVRLLRQPLKLQLERKLTDQSIKQARNNARSAYYTLLYYAFRPSATGQQFDQYWDMYVSEILPVSFTASISDVNHACEILAALLSGSGKSKPWEENRANMNGAVRIDELPSIDARWLRTNVDKVMQIFDKLAKKASWLPEKDREAPILLAWRNFMTALGTASSKEVKVSMETMTAVSHIINQIKRILDFSRPPTENPNQHISKRVQGGQTIDVIEKVRQLINDAVLKIGTIPFMEKRVILTSQHRFEAAETPSSRSSRDSSSLDSPVIHLMDLLLGHLGQQDHAGMTYVGAVKGLLAISLQSATTRRAQLNTLRHLTRLLSSDLHTLNARSVLWSVLAESTVSALRLPQQNGVHHASPQHPGYIYKDAMRVLEFGIQHCSADSIQDWVRLHDCIADAIREEVGVDSIGLVMTEPLAIAIHRSNSACNDVITNAAASVLKTMHWPRSIECLDRAQRVLWGPTQRSTSAILANHSENLYSMMESMLKATYKRFKELNMDSIEGFLTAVINCIKFCPLSYQQTLINRIQHGIALWVEDADDLLKPLDSLEIRGILEDVNTIWTMMVSILENADKHDTNYLFSVRQLLTSGIGSRHRSIVILSIEMWNCTFGLADSLKYPEDLRGQLLKLQAAADIRLPTFPEPRAGEDVSPPNWFIKNRSDDATSLQDLPTPDLLESKTAASTVGHFPSSSVAQYKTTRQGFQSSSPARRRVETPPKARLRHNDSQIEFAAVGSSPLAPERVDSQHLTDRQKEVRQRQGIEAAMFPEIRSSPKSASRGAEYSLPKLVFNQRQENHLKPMADEETSPVYPPDPLMNEFLGSSPTPASSKKTHDMVRSDNDPPSSPPFLSSNLRTENLALPNEVVAQEHQSVGDRQDMSKHNFKAKHSTSVAWIDVSEDKIAVNEDNSDMSDVEDSNSKPQLAEPTVPSNPPDDRIMSDTDVFVDAPSERMEDVPAMGQDDQTITNTEAEREDHELPTEDDQVTAQLVSEMERASSQQCPTENGEEVASRMGRKRKAHSDKNFISNKRARNDPGTVVSLIKADIPKPGERVAECVLIDSRPIEGGQLAPVIHIKKERSQSPSLIAETQPIAASPKAKRSHSGRAAKRSGASQLDSEPSSIIHNSSHSPTPFNPTSTHESSASAKSSQPRRSVRRSRDPASSPQTSSTSATKTLDPKPGSVTKTGRRPASMRWFWSPREPESPQDQSVEPTPQESNPGRRNDRSATHAGRPIETQRSTEKQLPSDDQTSDSQGPQPDDVEDTTAKDDKERLEEEGAGRGNAAREGKQASAEGILQGFKAMLDQVKRVALGREEERAMVAVLFESVQEVHEAGRRHNDV